MPTKDPTIQSFLYEAFPHHRGLATLQHGAGDPDESNAGKWSLNDCVCGLTCRRVIEKGAALYAEYRDSFGKDYAEVGDGIVKSTIAIVEVICYG